MEGREHGEQVVGPLHRRHPAEPAHDERPGRDPVAPAQLGDVPVERHARLELDPEPDHGEPVCGATPSATSSSRTSGLTATSRSVPRHEDRLDRPEQERAPTAEVPAKDMAVERVDDHGGPARAGEERRCTADRSRLGRVRVDDVGAEPPDQVREPRGRERVPQRRELPREAGERDDLDPGSLGDERHRLLAAADVPRHERGLVPSLGEPACEIGDMERGAADVEPGDHAQNADRPHVRLRAHRGDE